MKRNTTTELANCAKEIHAVWQRKNTIHLADWIITNYCIPERFKSMICIRDGGSLPPQRFGPDGQNPRRYPRGPRVLGTKISL